VAEFNMETAMTCAEAVQSFVEAVQTAQCACVHTGDLKSERSGRGAESLAFISDLMNKYEDYSAEVSAAAAADVCPVCRC